VLASGFGALSVCDAIAEALPKEDVVLLADHAFAPYAKRRPDVVRDRLARLADEQIAERAPKLLVLASAQGCADALELLRGRLAPMVVVGLDGIASQASARSGLGRVALVTGDSCLRGAQLARSLKYERGGGMVTWGAIAGLRELVEGGADTRGAVVAEVTRLTAAGIDAIALGCPHASAVASQVKLAAGESVVVVDSAALAAERTRRLLMRSGLTARRHRPGRRVLMSSNPSLGQDALARR
jgi:glutamate racemase